MRRPHRQRQVKSPARAAAARRCPDPSVPEVRPVCAVVFKVAHAAILNRLFVDVDYAATATPHFFKFNFILSR